MELIDRILCDENIRMAVKAVKSNKGAAGIDKMQVSELWIVNPKSDRNYEV